MSRTIRVDDDVFRELQGLARPFEDTPNDVVRMLLDRKANSGPRPSLRRGRNVYVAPDGTRFTSRQLVERFGLDVLGSDTFNKLMRDPSNFGLTHRADSIATKKGFAKSKG